MTAAPAVVPSCQKLKDVESVVTIVELNGDDLVKDYSNEIERMLGSKMKSVKVRDQRRPPSAAPWWPGGETLFSPLLRG